MLARELTAYGKDVKCQLVRLGMTQVELAGLVGTSKQYLGKIIFGERSGDMYLEHIDQELVSNQNARRKNTLTPYGQEVKCRLIELNMTQVELAEMVGTSKQYLGKIFHGVRSGAKYLESINSILGLEQEIPKAANQTGILVNDKSINMVIIPKVSMPVVAEPDFTLSASK